MESAIFCLAGLYNVTAENIQDHIPVEKVPKEHAYMVGGYASNCAAYERDLKEAMNSVDILSFLRITAPLRQYLAHHSGIDTETDSYKAIFNAMLLRDILYVEDSFGKMYAADWL